MTARVDPALRPLAQFFVEGIPYNRFVGMRVDVLQPGRCVVRIPFRPELIGDPMRPALHGGVTSALLDTAGGLACISRLDLATQMCSTVDLRVDYLRPGPPEDLLCEAHVVRLGNRVAVARMEAFPGALPDGEDAREPFATGQGVYNVVRRSFREAD